jgi:hypothetical protein
MKNDTLGHPRFIQTISEDEEFPNGCFARSFDAFFAHPAAPRLLSLALFSRSFICKQQQQRQLAKREERERETEGKIMNLQIAPSWMKNTRLDESRSDYGLDNDPLMDDKL